MKKIYLSFFATRFAINFSYAQNTFPSSGNVGIGTTSPASALDIGGLLQLSGINSAIPPVGLSYGLFPYGGIGLGLFSGATGSTQGIGIWTNPGGTPMEAIRILSGGNVGIGTTAPLTKFDVRLATKEHVQFVADLNGGSVGTSGIVSINDANSAYTPLGFWASNYYFGGGSVGIATNDTKGYTFAVNGTAIATSMTVKLYANWPDYVFKKNYKLPSLLEIQAYISKNKHLPGMPSEAEVAKHGINLGEIVQTQTKKIEELTLYLIEKDKEITSQQAQINLLKQQLEVITKKLK